MTVTTSRGGVGGSSGRVAATTEGLGWAVVDGLTFAGVKEGKSALKVSDCFVAVKTFMLFSGG